MALFTIADLHLSQSADHPMDVFGARWENYTEKICKNWRAVVCDTDTVVLPGDISWGMTLLQAREDFALLESLPGKKLIGKGNHDFWWVTANKLSLFFKEQDFKTISLLYNNAIETDEAIVCGTRGWFLEEERQRTVGEVDFEKIKNREAQRLKLSLDAAKKLQATAPQKEILVFLHFPPVYNGEVLRDFCDLFAQYGIRRCFYGHIHGMYRIPPIEYFEGVEYHIISSDYLNFAPKRILFP